MSLALDPVQVEPAFRLVARTIEGKFLAGEIVPGDPLPFEAGLAEKLGVNRSTIREAIRVLEQNGFVKREAGRKALKDSTSLTALHIEFHDLVARARRNRAIQMARLPLSELFYPPFLKVMSRLNAGERLLVAHEAIHAAIRDHDEKRARE